MPSGMFAEDKLCRMKTYTFQAYNLISRLLLKKPILMDAGFVGKGISPHNRLVRLHGNPCYLGNKPAAAYYLFCIYSCISIKNIAPCPQGHHNLLHGTISRTLSHTIYSAFNLSGSV